MILTILAFLACDDTPKGGGSDTDTDTDTTDTDTATPPDTSDPSTLGPPPAATWDSVRYARDTLVDVVSDDSTTWALDGAGGVLLVGDPWVDLGNAPLGSVTDADARDGTVWAVSYGVLGRFDGAAWVNELLPDGMDEPHSVVARADGTVAVLAAEEGGSDCDYDCPPSTTNRLASWDGATWTVHATDPTERLEDLVETGDGELVAVGGSGWVARWDGTTWVDLHRDEPGDLHAVAAVDGAGIVAVGEDGLVIRGPTLDSLAVSSTGSSEPLHDVDVGDDGTVWAFSWGAAFVDPGSGWSRIELPGGLWTGIHAAEAGAIVTGDQGGPTALSGGAEGWTVAWHAASLYSVEDVWVDPSGEAWLAATGKVGRWSAAGLEAWALPTVFWLRAISGADPDDVVAVGVDGVFSWDGADWTLAWPDGGATLWDVSVAPDGTAFVASAAPSGEDTVPMLLRRDAGVWSVDPTPIPTGARALIAIQAFAADDVYALTWSEPASLMHFDGSAWTDVSGDLGEGVECLWGRSGQDLYLGRSPQEVGPPSLHHYNGATITAIPGAPASVTALAGTGIDVIVAGKSPSAEAGTWILRNGVWTELFRSERTMAVGAGAGVAVVADEVDAWRSPPLTPAR